ncbi:cytochrome P450 [Nocardia rhizosphaerihabitans]|uniref:Cytochrome P450 n=1 Tax=Nocardia rhizosphaerihabitans TaxID=1691570 RepID=A0ABQ2K3K7_9NOCA|nr:cytochrome P450 [Nocardia rhizosphaerihabitans]GGN67660.1 putative cytochrome P450 [Nocardia rhizosphaerihabitans]
MLTRAWFRWLVVHRLSRTYLLMSARRGDPLALILAGPDRGRGAPRSIEEIRQLGRMPTVSKVRVTADHEICKLILRDRRFGVVTPNNRALPQLMRWVMTKTDLELPNLAEPPSMLVTDPPEHTVYRRLVGQAFAPKAITKLRERVVEVTDDLLDGLTSTPRPDLIDEFCERLPIAIIAELLGLPADMHSTLLRWGDTGAPLLDRGLTWATFRRAVEDMAEGQAYFDEQIAKRTEEPGDDVLSTLVTGGELTHREQVANAALLLDAGFLTTVNMLGNGIALLTRHPDQLQMLLEQPELWPGAVEEILRYDGPIRITGRIASSDIDIADQHVEYGSLVLLLLAGANKDPTVFPDPERFDVTRPNAAEHLSFSGGVHSCLGSSLARLEGTIALRALFERYPDLHLDGPPIPRGLVNLNSYRSMPAKLHAA